MTAIKQVYQYLQATQDHKIVYRNVLTNYSYLEIYTNADLASNKKTAKLFLAYIGILAGYPFFWSSKKQTTVNQFSINAKYNAASEATKKAF